ncbi:NADPH:quinone oxidoreductase family protein [Alphaproteobacteria bacterium]|nr:NADPH:quinone oxidoreductase family protein [Alphaproteobacteria bacterium]|tara:strand:+ start:1556 stop:2524 length:969 start_codon:yes stop_codon:yes gene_type:complete
MKAIVCNDFGPIQNIEYKDVNEPVIQDQSVIINVKSVGVNFPDGLLVQGKYQLKPETPFIPGMEVAGEIVKIGPSVLNLKIGDRVAALSQLSGYAEQAVVQEKSVFKIPSKMSFDDSCALLCAYGTSHYALKQRANLKKNELLVVLGASGSTGIAAIQIGKIMGAKVIAVSSNSEKQKIAKDNGADISIGYDNLKEELKSISNGKGVDVIFDPVGGDIFDTVARTMARSGRLLVIGFASGTIPKLAVNLALVKEFSVVGVFWGAFTRGEPIEYKQNMIELFNWYKEGLLKPLIQDSYPLSEAAVVLEKILARGAKGKIILKP